MFSNPVVGGTTLIRPAIQSPNFVTTVSGWSINIDGSAEFNNVAIRGTLTVTGPSTLAGTLTMSGGACILTAAAPAQRISICSSPQNQISFFSGDATETIAGSLSITVSGGVAQLSLANPQMNTGGTSSLLMQSGQGHGVWTIFSDNASLTGTAFINALHSTYGRNLFDNNVAIGGAGITDFEVLTIQGSNSGISIRPRTGANRFVIYNADGNNLFIWWQGTNVEMVAFDDHGRIIVSRPYGDAAGYYGSWLGDPTNRCAVNTINDNNRNGSSYRLLSSGGDSDTYLSVGNVNGTGAFQFRLSNNGATFGSWGVNNRGLGVVESLDIALPALGGGNTVNVQASGSWQVGFVSSAKAHKTNIRTLAETPEKDSGPDNPIFRLRPVRFNWVQDEYELGKGWALKGVANADELNAKHPNGVAGLIAEEVYEHCPDAVLHRSAKAPEPWDESRHGMPWHDSEGNPVTHVPGWDETIIGLDHDRLIAYLIDAVQYLRKRVDHGSGN